MPKFAYAATTREGASSTGVEKADSRAAAELALYDRELRDIRVTEKKSFLQLEISGPRVKREDLMHLSRQMAAFIRAGLPILDAVHTIGEESENSSVRRVMTDIEDGLRSGERFSDCLDRHANIFPDFYRGIVRSAELTGELDTVLTRLALYLERDLEARRKIKSATIYPTAVAIMSIVTIVVLAAYVLPKFKVFFESLHAKLPLPTRMLLSVTDFLSTWWWALLAGLGIVVVLIVATLQTERGRHAKDRFLLSIPVLGETIQYALVERFCRVLASMVSAGVALPEALRVATESLRNRVYIQALSGVNEAMLEGEGLAGPLAKTALFPPTAAQMLRVGEETGTLDGQLEVTAQYYETELDYKLKKLTALFEPAIIVVMGLLVGFVAVALVSAMYGIFNQVKV
ncbi:MAG: type II secretion system F family protein [Jatrophihabitantaceae bacterium]